MSLQPRFRWVATRCAVAFGVEQPVVEEAFADEAHLDTLERLCASGGTNSILILYQPRFQLNEVRPVGG